MKKIQLVLLVIVLAFCSCFLINPSSASAYTEEEKLVMQSWRLVNEAYLDDSFNDQNWWLLRKKFLQKPLENKEQAYQVIAEMLATLDDPYTRLLPPQKYQNLQITTSGELSGIGLQISINSENNHIEVVSPLPGSPADVAGIKPRDRVLKIDGIVADTLSLDEAASKIRGEAGTYVEIDLQSNADSTVNHYNILRDTLALSSVLSHLDTSVSDYPIGYLRLNQFSGSATHDLQNAIAELETEGAKAYVLDLRNNPGGLLQAGIEIARLWLPESTVVYTVNRQGIFGSYTSNGNRMTDAPLAVLVNGGSASSSEIVAGALKDNDRAVLVGEKTFGKGLIQSLFELPDGAGIAITVAKYETPNHEDINKKGILPDVEVNQEPISYFEITTEKDQQYQKAVDYLINSEKGATTMITQKN